MASRDNKGWRLKPVTPMDYDPHLQEQKLAEPHQLSHTLTSQGKDGLTYVDVIARLEDGNGARPSALKVLRNPGQSDILTGRVALEKIEEVRGHANIASLKAATELFLDLHRSVSAIQADPRALQEAFQLPGLDGSGVILGVVDVGCDFRHQNFRRPTGETRLLYLWDQSDPLEGNTVPPPEGFGYGREFTAAKINEALFKGADPDPYSKLGYTPVIGSHGTHVLDIAAGNGREPNHLGGKPGSDPEERSPRGVAPGADLIFVHLKCGSHNCLGNSRHLLEAVEYIFEKAKELGRPAVVNLSLATSGGPHDGTTLVEQGFERLLREPGRAIVVSAGNAFATNTHIEGKAPYELRWQTDPRADKNEMEIWYPGNQTLKVTVVTPSETELAPVELGQTREIYLDDERRGRISHRKKDPNNGDNQIDIRILRPQGEERAESWIVKLEAEEGKEAPFHAWIEQDDQGSSQFQGETSSDHTLGSICCGENLITVGAFDTFERAYLALPYEATAAGPTREGKEDKPDVSAPGVAILAARAQGGTTIMSGTSMAAPHVAGLVALVFQCAQRIGLGPLTIAETRRVIRESARPVNPSQNGWHPQFGRGRIDGVAALKRLQEIQEKRKPQAAPGAELTGAGGNGNGNGKHMKPEISAKLKELLAEYAPDGIEIQVIFKEKKTPNGKEHPTE